jgi:hypothetical protein
VIFTWLRQGASEGLHGSPIAIWWSTYLGCNMHFVLILELKNIIIIFVFCFLMKKNQMFVVCNEFAGARHGHHHLV